MDSVCWVGTGTWYGVVIQSTIWLIRVSLLHGGIKREQPERASSGAYAKTVQQPEFQGGRARQSLACAEVSFIKLYLSAPKRIVWKIPRQNKNSLLPCSQRI